MLADFLETVANSVFSLSYSCSTRRHAIANLPLKELQNYVIYIYLDIYIYIYTYIHFHKYAHTHTQTNTRKTNTRSN